MDPLRTAALLWGTVVHRPYVYAFLACFVVFAVRQLGGRRTITFAVTAWLVAFAAEWSSTRNGFPFGPYSYFDATRDRELWISNVPFWDSLSFVFLSYFSLALASELLAGRVAREPGGRVPRGLGRPLPAERSSAGPHPAWPDILHPAAPLLGGALMMLLDVVIDPVALQGEKWFLGRIYEYPYRGFWFGVTAANFVGWFAVGAVSQWLFQREVAVLPWCRGPWRPTPAGFRWGVLGVYAGVFGFNLAVTIAIRDWALAAASGAVIAATLVPVTLRLRAARPTAARVWICAATRTEAAACRRGISGVAGVEVVVTGVGPARAAAGLRRRLARGHRPALIVSAGFAGAIGAELAVGEAVTARAVYRLAGGRPRPVVLPAGMLVGAPAARRVDVMMAEAVVRGARDGRGVVDMESAALAEVAVAAGARFAVLRVVTDTPSAPLPGVARTIATGLAGSGWRRVAGLAAAVREGVSAPGAAVGLAFASRGWSRALEGAVRANAAALAEVRVDGRGRIRGEGRG